MSADDLSGAGNFEPELRWLREEVATLKGSRDRLALDALAAISGARVITPQEGYVKAPHCLSSNIADLARERDKARQRFDAACAANDRLKRTLDELGCSSVSDGWSNTRALKAEGELLVLQRAVRKVAAVVTTNGGDAQLDEHEAKAWRAATVVIVNGEVRP